MPGTRRVPSVWGTRFRGFSAGWDFGSGLVEHNGWWRAELRDEEEMPGLLRRIVENGCDILEARLVQPTIEDVYKRILEQHPRKAGEQNVYTG